MPTRDMHDFADINALYDNAACGLLVTDSDGTIRHVNRTFCTWVGREPAQLIGHRRFQDLLTMGSRIFHQTHWAPLLQMQGSVAELKLDVVHRDGQTIPMIMNAIRREHAGTPRHELALFVAEDRHKYERELLLARRQAEEALFNQTQAHKAKQLADTRLHLALTAAQLYVWEVDPVTHERRFEASVAALLGLQHGPIHGQQYLASIDPADREREAAALSHAIAHPDEEYRCTYRLIGADDEQRVVMATARCITDQHGEVIQIVGVLNDITELSEQRMAAEQRALFAEQMVGIVSHDLRNPLTSIMMGTEILQMPDAPAAHKRAGNLILKSAQRMQRMVADLLDFTMARIGTGLKVNAKPMDLHTLVDGITADLTTIFPERVLLHQSSGSGACLADADRLTQLIGNLVSNAVAYGTPDTPVSITSLVESDQCQLHVHNVGNVIPKSLLPTLFQPMVRGTDDASPMRSVGLGLYIVREIARAHRGTVSVTSSEQHGTTFVVTFPKGNVDSLSLA